MIQTTDIPALPVPSGTETLNELKGLSINEMIERIVDGLISFGFKLLIAIFVFYIGRFIIIKLYKTTLSVMTRRKMDLSLTTFVLSLIRMTLYFILIVTIIGILGIETSSFLAIFASAGVALGMALSGTLQNFAGGVLILLLKPYKVGDYIETQGYAGTVKSIQLFSTVINTVDNKAIIIPNGGLSTGTVNNYSLENHRRVDWNIGLSYGTDFQAAKEAILKMLDEDDRIIKSSEDEQNAEEGSNADLNVVGVAESAFAKQSVITEKKWWQKIIPHIKRKKEVIQNSLTDDIEMNPLLPVVVDMKPFVGLSSMGDSSINLVVRAWTKSPNYWGVYFELNERFYSELPKLGFSFPFPQLDVHLQK